MGSAYHQLRIGLAATAMSDYFSWGIYIVNFVFFIGIMAQPISATLRLPMPIGGMRSLGWLKRSPFSPSSSPDP